MFNVLMPISSLAKAYARGLSRFKIVYKILKSADFSGLKSIICVGFADRL